MTNLVLTDQPPEPSTDTTRPDAKNTPIICPVLYGLTASQSDCAILIPRGNANEMLMAALQRPGIATDTLMAAVLCADPFINRDKFLARLKDIGVRRVTNWPSGIFFEGNTATAMATVPAGYRQEIEWLISAGDAELEPSMFIVSREQGLAAISAGISHLILHPGLLHEPDPIAVTQLNSSLARVAADLKAANGECTISLYRHPSVFGNARVDVDWADHLLDYGVRA